MYLADRPWMTSLMDKGDTLGICANCQQAVREYLSTLDDCYGVYRGECPHCHAINLLDPRKGARRGYTGKEIFLTLPTDHEMKLNNWLEDVPTKKCACVECQSEIGGKR